MRMVDLNTVIKASQAISGEVELGKLLVTIMKIVIQNAGASRGLMILENAGKYFIEIEYSAESNDVKVLNSAPLNEHRDLSSSVVNYVIRTKNSVILKNASGKGDFTNDPYIRKYNSKSVLCAPVLNHGKLMCILYLENNISTGAFTKERLQILNILSSQIAISIENAQFYENLEKTVRERTSDLRKANYELLKEISERKKMEDKIHFLAYYDQLTSLPNRTLFIEKINSIFSSAKRYKRKFAVMFLDIDNFKRINDSLGHNIGDMLIKEVANRLVRSIRKDDSITHQSMQPLASTLDTVARLGGDEFTILLSEIMDPENASRVAERIRGEFITPVEAEENKINVTVSIGIAIYPNDGDSVEALLKNADIAMNNVKNIGRNGFQYYNKSMNISVAKKLGIETELNKALGNKEFSIYYQPLIELKNKRIFGIEALIRWHHPQKGDISPSDFIPIAVESGLIIGIGEFVLNSIGNFYIKWIKDRLPGISIFINISIREFYHNSFIDTINRFIHTYNILPDKLVLEITENGIVNDIERSNKIINAVRNMGIKTALDDFGTDNMVFFNVLRRTSVDILKIDYSLIKNISMNAQDSALVASLISIGHSMKLFVTAEGVENEQQLRFLESKDCDLAQGFYFSKPANEIDSVKLLTENV
jgi:diguanylate cyclase (GGDEF)-like protein